MNIDMILNDPTMYGVAAAIAILVAFIVGYGIRYFKKNLQLENKRERDVTPVTKTVAGATVEPEAKAAPKKVEPPRLKTLEEALRGTKTSLWGRMANALSGSPDVTDAEMSTLEEVLFTSDLGPQTAQLLLEKVGDRLKRNEKNDVERLRLALKEEMLKIFATNGHEDQEPSSTDIDLFAKVRDLKASQGTVVWMVAGVNGAGKTTTIGKLASIAQNQGLKTMIVAGDTFRAAADAQLKEWSTRSGAAYFSAENTKDPSAVAFQALEKAKTDKIDLVLVDTAGRLHTQENLMDELKKMKRVMVKIFPQAPDEVLLVLDANNGQNALEQARQFHKALDLTAVVLTKLDGTSKGGVAVGLVSELHIPIRFIGVGEAIEDLRVFSPREFVDSIV